MVVKDLLIILAVLALITFAFVKFQPQSSQKLENSASSSSVVRNSEVISPDGSMRLTMDVVENEDGFFYSFKAYGEDGKALPLFTKTTNRGETMALHHNGWSPNNKYVLIEDRVGSSIDYLVFKANGENFSTGEKYLNATALFDQKVKNYNLKEITGWDDSVLVSVRTVNGPHFWFDLTTQSFIQLVR